MKLSELKETVQPKLKSQPLPTNTSGNHRGGKLREQNQREKKQENTTYRT